MNFFKFIYMLIYWINVYKIHCDVFIDCLFYYYCVQCLSVLPLIFASLLSLHFLNCASLDNLHIVCLIITIIALHNFLCFFINWFSSFYVQVVFLKKGLCALWKNSIHKQPLS